MLLGLFVIQSRGTASVGRLFGPVMLVWFAVLGLLGLAQIVQNPAVLAALNPRYAVGLFRLAGWQAFVALGAIVLAVTGAEALYADMGHFGQLPIRLAWLGLVLPAWSSTISARVRLVLRDPAALEHPFYHLAPGLGAVAADRARHLCHHHRQPGGDLRRVLADRTGDPARLPAAHAGQAHLGHRDGPDLYPARELAVDGGRAAAGLRLPLSSGNLAAAYGISVTGAMAIDAVLAGLVAAWRWGWGPAAVAGLWRIPC